MADLPWQITSNPWGRERESNAPWWQDPVSMDLFSRPNGAFIKSKQNTYHHLRGIWEGFLGKGPKMFQMFFFVLRGIWRLEPGHLENCC